jgi:hypothetical protein
MPFSAHEPEIARAGNGSVLNYTGSQWHEFDPRQEHNFIDIIEFDEYAKAGRPPS